MQHLSVPANDKVLVGFETSDDAGVYRLTDDMAIIQTLDFITPIVDDPYLFGQIAACNSISDVYAMGGRPVTGLNIVCFPIKKYSLDVLRKVIEGGIDILEKAGVALLGGHSVDDDEMKYGISVTGIVHPDRVIRNRGLQTGDAIILTKPLGTGIISTAIKNGLDSAELIDPFIASMTTFNGPAAELMSKYVVHACTDVTGFGLLGHLKEMIEGSKTRVTITLQSIPLLPGVLDNARKGMVPGGLSRNRTYAGGICSIETDGKKPEVDVLFDPQTSGGLLIGLPQADAVSLLAQMQEQGLSVSKIIGFVEDGDKAEIIVR